MVPVSPTVLVDCVAASSPLGGPWLRDLTEALAAGARLSEVRSAFVESEAAAGQAAVGGTLGPEGAPPLVVL